MRLGGVAAQQGADGYDKMRDAVTQQGAAAKLAAAQNQGLPGVFERADNTVERLKLQLYDLIDGPMTTLGTQALNLADGALDKFDTAILGPTGSAAVLGAAVSSLALSDFPMLEAAWGNIVEAGRTASEIIHSNVDALTALGRGATTSGGLLDTLQAAAQGTAAGLSGVLSVVQPLAAAGAALAGMFASLPGPIQTAVLALVGLRVAQSAFGSLMARNRDELGRFGTAAQRAGTFAQQLGPRLNTAAAYSRQLATANGAAVTTTQRLGSAAQQGSVQMGRFGSSIALLGQSSPGLARIQSSFVGAASSAALAGSSLARTQGAVAATGTAVRVAAGGLLSALGGPFGIAIAAAVAGLSLYAAAQRKAAQHNKELEANAKDLGTALEASGGALTNATQKAAALTLTQSKLAGSGESLLKYLDSVGISGSNAATGLAGSTEAMQANLSILKKNADAEAEANRKNIENSLNPVVGFKDLFNIGGFSDKSKEAQNAYSDYKKLADAAIEQADSIRRANQAAGNIDSSGTATALGTMRDTMQKFADSSGNAASKIDILNGGLAALRGDQLSTADAQQKVNDSIRGFSEALPEGGAAAILASGQIDTTTAAGSRLYDAMKGVQGAFDSAGTAAFQSAIAQNQSQQQAADAAAAAGQVVRDSFIAQAQQAGLTQTQAEALANTYRLFPTDLKTNISVGTTQALLDAQALKTAIDDATRDRYVSVQVAKGTVIDTPNGPRSIAQNPGQFADGGAIGGTGGPREDNQVILASKGEHMLDATDVDLLGGQAGVYRFREALNAGRIGKYADGGAIGGDGLDNMVNFARSNAGRDYEWGAWDCSMYMSQIAAAGMNAPLQRLWTTYSILDGKLAGMQPGGDEGHFRIGVSQEHMAGTLFLRDGSRVNVEDGGSNPGSTFGGGAAGYDDSQFGTQFHLPDSMLSPALQASLSGASASSATAVAKQQADIASAQADLAKAIETRDKTYADAESTPADKQVDDARVRQAELDVTKAQEAPASTADTIAPQAAAVGNFSADEITAMRAQIAVDNANLARNKVYADPTSTENDKREADFAFIEAQKKSTESPSGTDQPFSVSGRLKQLGSDLVSAGVDAAFEQLPFDLGQSRWLTTDFKQFAPKPPASFSQDELNGQLPVTPGQPGWVDQLTKTGDFNADTRAASGVEEDNPIIDWLLGPGKQWQQQVSSAIGNPLLRDDGGILPSGGAALNLSGHDEWVTTKAQRDQQMRDTAALRANSASGSVDMSGITEAIKSMSGGDYSVHIGEVRGHDTKQVIREINGIQQRQMMRYGGRPS